MKDPEFQKGFEYLPEEPEGMIVAEGLVLDCLVFVKRGDYKGRRGRVRKNTNMKVTIALIDLTRETHELLRPEKQAQLM